MALYEDIECDRFQFTKMAKNMGLDSWQAHMSSVRRLLPYIATRYNEMFPRGNYIWDPTYHDWYTWPPGYIAYKDPDPFDDEDPDDWRFLSPMEDDDETA